MSSTCKGTKNHMKELGVYPKTGCRVCGSLLWLRVYLFFTESDFLTDLAEFDVVEIRHDSAKFK